MKARTYTILMLVLVMLVNKKLLAQGDFSKAKKYYENFEYKLAIPYYLNALSNDSNLVSIENLADCYRLTHQYKEAKKYYALALEIPYYSATSVFYYAEVLMQLGEYDEALEQYEFYKTYEPENLNYIESCISSCKFAAFAKKNTDKYKVENIKEINTKYSESGVFVGQKNLYISTDRKTSNVTEIDAWTGNSYYKIMSIPYSIKNNKIVFQKAKNFNSTINSGYHVAFPSFNTEETKLFYTSTKIEEFPKRKFDVRATEFVNKMNITTASLLKKRWVIDSTLKKESEFKYSILHPCINREGTRIYFSSDMPGGYGSYDIYYCDIDEDGNISSPINLGNKLNTAGMEVFPSYATNECIYFSSKGHIGFGGLDIYKASLKNNIIISIENLGSPINSSFDDFSYVPLNDQLSIICSDREGGKGGDDLYIIQLLNNTQPKE